ncbi:RNA polymerase subunit sigma-70 [Cellulomonas sp. ATA003]|uniref:RNA polymerase subunit sigma-70 n=1 Tax=Cellulomonas sp. ATA003 TaxID=3073064 RepID=UPI002873A80A|nr:RNA polymerase subunit sigma-70 [Cellulomonas sp. ATA003]WNB85759.1 RNA polymerase subunit sigma-70 [Cellulomonas sp. ATA003]
METAEPAAAAAERARVGRDLRAAVLERRRADARVALLVQELRVRGATWTDVAADLGVSRQAARQRFGGDELAP